MTIEETIECKKAYVELYEIIQNMPLQEKRKIPNELILNLKNNMDKNYIFKFDLNKNILQQNLKIETKALVVELYEKYLAPESEKTFWEKYDNICLNIIEKEKNIKYNPNNIFYNEKVNSCNAYNQIDKESVNLPIEVKKANILTKFVQLIKKIFNI